MLRDELVQAKVTIVAILTQERDDVDVAIERWEIDRPQSAGSSVGSMISRSSASKGPYGPSVATGMSRLRTVNERPSRTSRR